MLAAVRGVQLRNRALGLGRDEASRHSGSQELQGSGVHSAELCFPQFNPENSLMQFPPLFH